jgi:Helix-turn-helix domain
MPRPLPVPTRQVIWLRLQDGQEPAAIAEALGLEPRTVRRLVARFRQGGRDAVAPASDRCGAATPRPAESLGQAAVALRRDHPTWGAGLIRVILGHRLLGDPLPSVRALQRWFRRADLAPAPVGRRPAADARRARRPHEVWQMDAAELVKLRSGQLVCWLRIVDECSGAVLWTAVFPPRPLESGPAHRGPGAAPSGLRPLGPARAIPGGQGLALGLAERPADGPGAGVDRPGGGRGLRPPAASAGQRRGGVLAADRQAVGRAR